MKPNLHSTQTKMITQPKLQGLKIREKKLEVKYKQLIQKHQTLNKFAPTVNNFDSQQLPGEGQISSLNNVTSRYGTQREKPTFVKCFSNSQNQEETFNKKKYQFFTPRCFLEKTSVQNQKHQNQCFIKSTPSIKSVQKDKKVPQITLKTQNSSQLPQSLTQTQSPTHQNLFAQQLVLKLDSDPSCYSNLWEKFLKSVKHIQANQESLCLAHVCQKDRQTKLLKDFMKEMDFLLEQHDHVILDFVAKFKNLKETELNHFYLQSHQLHSQLTQAKIFIQGHMQEYQAYLDGLKQQEKERKQMLQSKRQSSLTRAQSNNNSPLRHLQKDLNMNQKELKSLMEKKSKLNLQLDLSFQIQQRKKISKEKQAFNAKKAKLEKEKLSIENKMKEIRQKTEIKQKQVERYDFQKDKYMKEIQYFLKMLLKNCQYRLDGAVWTFRKMIEYGFEPHLSDFSETLDINAKSFLINEFRMMKEQQVFTLKPIESRQNKILTSRKSKKSSPNRKRVKSVTVSYPEQQNQNPITIKEDLNSNLPPNITDDPFYTFACKNLKPVPENFSIRKKSGSLNLMKTYDESLGQTESNQIKAENPKSSFRELTKQDNRNKLYFSAKKYIKSWIGEKGWNMLTTRTAMKTEQNKNEENFIMEQKMRTKQKFFKIGRSNTRYNSIVKTLYGSQEDLKASKKRVKTSFQ